MEYLMLACKRRHEKLLSKYVRPKEGNDAEIQLLGVGWGSDLVRWMLGNLRNIFQVIRGPTGAILMPLYLGELFSKGRFIFW